MPTKPKKVKLTITARWVSHLENIYPEYELISNGFSLADVHPSCSYKGKWIGTILRDGDGEGFMYSNPLSSLKAAQQWCEKQLKEME